MPCCLRLLAIKVAPSTSLMLFLLLDRRDANRRAICRQGPGPKKSPSADYAFMAMPGKRFPRRNSCHPAMTGAHGTVLGPIAPIFEQDWSSGERRWMASRSKTWCAAIGLLLWASYPNGAPAPEHAVPKLAFFGFQLINTSLEPTTNGELHRLDMLDKLFRERLDNSGRFKIVPVPPDN